MSISGNNKNKSLLSLELIRWHDQVNIVSNFIKVGWPNIIHHLTKAHFMISVSLFDPKHTTSAQNSCWEGDWLSGGAAISTFRGTHK